jgi:hypothetical protein
MKNLVRVSPNINNLVVYDRALDVIISVRMPTHQFDSIDLINQWSRWLDYNYEFTVNHEESFITLEIIVPHQNIDDMLKHFGVNELTPLKELKKFKL